MAIERSAVDKLLESGSENPKRIFAALNAEPTKPKKDVVISPEDAHTFIRTRYENLQNPEIEAALNFLNSEAGVKQRELSQQFSQLVPEFLSQKSSIQNAPATKAEKVRRFFEAAGALDALKSIPQGPDPSAREKVYQFAVDFYADRLSEEELDDLIAHYSSPDGKAAVNAALSLTKDILHQYGI